ncbi:cytochrome P450 2F2-like [Mugil cephalus]|uniref:cytochrome P450 2F2-like n=1 Tax=Mugil cephalus TaxID=48193 RepID=UPI001FB72023|nr:cytochrome P450 2F2-like [Mugil cephalus]
MLGSSASEVLFISVNHSITLMGKVWLTVMIFLRILILLFAGYPLYQDEQERFVCNTIQPGCANVCYDMFSPVSLFRFWLVQLIALCLPYIIFVIYVVHKVSNTLTVDINSWGHTKAFQLLKIHHEPFNNVPVNKSPAVFEQPGWTQCFTGAYILHLMFRTLLEAGFGAAHYYLFGFYIPRRFLCQHPPCTTQVDCYVSRPTEKTVMLNFMLGVAALSLFLNVLDFICAVKRSVRQKSKRKMMVGKVFEEEQCFLSSGEASKGTDLNAPLAQQDPEAHSGQSGSFRKRRGSKASGGGGALDLVQSPPSLERCSPGPPGFNTNGNNGYSASQEDAPEKDGSEVALCPQEPIGTPRSIRRPKNFPPGPSALPVLGNLLNLSLDNPMRDFERLRNCYGNVYSLFLGPKPAVIINGLQAMKEAMITKAADFAGRPQDIFVSDLTQNGMVLADYGTGWKEHRRFALMTLRNFGLGKQSMEQRILGEMDYTMETLEKRIGTALSPQVLFHNVASNIICQVLFGTRYDYDDEFIKVVVQCFKENSKIANGAWAMLYDSVPMIRKLPLPFMKAFRNIETCKNLVSHLISEHKATRVPRQPRDFLDCYLDELDTRGNCGSSFCEDRLVMFILDLHFAGTDTTSNTLLTGFLYLMTHPRIQERCQQEIDHVLGKRDQASYDDRHNMPYVQAVIHEVQRVANTVPLSVFHCTTKDTELMGYSLPRGTSIIQNLNSVLTEEGQWKFPHEFNPENFLNDHGEFVKPEAFMPFSAGPRMCLGEGLARMELFLIMVTLLRKFEFIWPEDGGRPDYAPVYGVTLSPRPYRMKVQLRATQQTDCRYTE